MIGNDAVGIVKPISKIGDVSGGNYVDINKTQGVRYKGDTTVWKDLVTSLFGRRLSSTTGRVDYDWDENTIKFQNNGSITNSADRVGGNQEINHEFLVGTGIIFKPHMHWWQQVTSNVVKANVITARWRLQRNNYEKTTAWTTITCETGPGGDDVWDNTARPNGLYNQISRFDDIVIDCDISDTIQFQIARTDSETGDIHVHFFDIHGEVDSDGSDEEISKS